MKKLTKRTTLRILWDYIKGYKFALARIRILNLASLSDEHLARAFVALDKEIKLAESQRKYLAVGQLRAVKRDLEDGAYDTTE